MIKILRFVLCIIASLTYATLFLVCLLVGISSKKAFDADDSFLCDIWDWVMPKRIGGK